MSEKDERVVGAWTWLHRVQISLAIAYYCVQLGISALIVAALMYVGSAFRGRGAQPATTSAPPPVETMNWPDTSPKGLVLGDVSILTPDQLKGLLLVDVSILAPDQLKDAETNAPREDAARAPLIVPAHAPKAPASLP